MITFEKITEENLLSFDEFYKRQKTRMSVYSAAYQFMWNKDLFSPDYAVVGDNLILRGGFNKKEKFFFYPVSLDGKYETEVQAIEAIEEYCRARYKQLRFLNVPEEKVGLLCARYQLGMHVENIRTWEDYLYYTEDFKNFASGKFAGQRNHIKKFYKLFPSATFKVYTPEDKDKILAFLDEYEETQFTKSDDEFARRELDMVKLLVPRFEEFGVSCGYMEVDGKVVSMAAGEVCGDTMMQHVEKALRGYDGVYPATAQAFVKTFCGEDVVYLNREDDSGDLGLRKSKMQYNPCRMVKKYSVTVDKPLQRVERIPTIKTERLTIKRIQNKDKEAYLRLASDVARNEFWGYDYRKDLKDGVTADGDYFLSLIRRDFKNRNEMAMGIYLKGALIGEVVLHNFGYKSEGEVGMRLLPEYEGNGYAGEAVRAACDYAISVLGVEVMEAKCFKENPRSRSSLVKAGLRANGEDEVYYYFRRTPKD